MDIWTLATLLLALLLVLGCAELALSHHKQALERSETTEDRVTPRSARARPKAGRRRNDRRVAQHAMVPDAVLIDVNNVRGAIQFDRDVDEACLDLYHWATSSTAPDTYTVLAVDHGETQQAFLVGERVVVSFAGPKEAATADDMIEVGTRYCVKSARERVLVVSSDVLLRTRCTLAAQEEHVGRANLRSHWVSFEHRSTFAGRGGSRETHGDALESLFLGPTPSSPKAAAAARRARRERAGIKQELTCMRREQAAALYERLEAATSVGYGAARLLACSPGNPELAGVGELSRVASAAQAHCAWINDTSRVERARAELTVGVEEYWNRKSEGAWGR